MATINEPTQVHAKKEWETPTLEVICLDSVEGGTVALVNESSTSNGNHGTISH